LNNDIDILVLYRERENKSLLLLLCVTVLLAAILRSLHSWQAEEKEKEKRVRTVGTKEQELKACMYVWRPRTIVMQELFDEVYMGEDHTSTAVPFKLQFIEGVTREPTGRVRQTDGKWTREKERKKKGADLRNQW
jgi:hypothetical protein